MRNRVTLSYPIQMELLNNDGNENEDTQLFVWLLQSPEPEACKKWFFFHYFKPELELQQRKWPTHAFAACHERNEQQKKKQPRFDYLFKLNYSMGMEFAKRSMSSAQSSAILFAFSIKPFFIEDRFVPSRSLDLSANIIAWSGDHGMCLCVQATLANTINPIYNHHKIARLSNSFLLCVCVRVSAGISCKTSFKLFLSFTISSEACSYITRWRLCSSTYNKCVTPF